MIPPEHSELAHAIMKEGAEFDEAVEIAARIIRHLNEAGYSIARARGEQA